MKRRLDKLMVERRLVRSRERAGELIKHGKVAVGGQVARKPSQSVDQAAGIVLLENDIPWVSRGGLKLEKAIDHWQVPVDGKVCLDIGACTGGFTEVLLAAGARKVYALDVGHGQLAESLLGDHRVVNMEGVNIRQVKTDRFGEPIDLIVIDVSFISLSHVLPVAKDLLAEDGAIVALIKPHFEVGKGDIKKGFVHDPALHEKVIDKIRLLAKDLLLDDHGVIEAPLHEDRNKEFLIYLENNKGKR